MEWTAKSPAIWDWENLMAVSTPPSDNTRNERGIFCEIDDGDKGTELGSIYSLENGSGSDLGLASISKSSKSASTNSSSTFDVKTSNDLVTTKPNSSSPALEASLKLGEPSLGLKLGKRTYFEDFCAKTPALSGKPVSSVASAKRTRSSYLSTQAPRCQVEGCGVDLSSAKDYHRKHRVCITHTKSSKVFVAGQERRFCQQCSRFHALSEFDEKKRSCRRRLSDHNARRRKPPVERGQLNSSSIPSMLYDERQNASVLWNSTILFSSRSNTSSTWNTDTGNKVTLTRESMVSPSKVGGVDAQLPQVNSSGFSNSIPTHHSDSNGFLLTFKASGIKNKAPNPGLQQNPVSCNNVDAAQNLTSSRALSLLSMNSSWGSCNTKAMVTHEHPQVHNMPQLVTSQGFPLTSTCGSWTQEQQEEQQQHQQSPESRVTLAFGNGCDSNGYDASGIQVSRTPYEGFFSTS